MKIIAKLNKADSKLFFALSNIIYLGTIFIADIFIARNFPLEKVSAWKQLILLVQFTGVLLSFGIIEGFRFNIAKEVASINKYLGVAVSFILLIAIIFWSIFFFRESRFFFSTILGINIISKISLLIPLLYILLSLCALYQQICLTKNMIKVVFFAMSCFSTIFSLTLLILLNLFSHSFEICIVYSFIVAYLFQLAIYIYYTKSIPILDLQEFYIKIQALLKYGFPLFIATYIGILILHVDKIIVNKLGGTILFAIYSVGALEIPIISLVVKTHTSISYPKLVEHISKNELTLAEDIWFNDLLKTSYITYPIIILCIFFSKEIITTFYGIKYVDAVPVFKTYCLILIWRNSMYGTLLSIKGKGTYITYYSLIALIVNVLLCFLLYSRFGLEGIVIAIFLATTTLALLLLYSENILKKYFLLLLRKPIYTLLLILVFISYIL